MVSRGVISRRLDHHLRPGSAVLAVPDFAPVVDALRSRLRAVRQDVPELGKLGVAILFHEPGDVVATTPAARLAFDREGRDEEVRERVRVVSHRRSNSGFKHFSRLRLVPLR